MICQTIKRFACSRWMQCEARSQVNQGESEGSVFAKAPPGQGGLFQKMLVAA